MRRLYNVTINNRRLIVEVSCSEPYWGQVEVEGRVFWDFMPDMVSIHDITFQSGRSLPTHEIDRLLRKNERLAYDLGHMLARDIQNIKPS